VKLDYSILWFEDKPGWLEPVQEILEINMDDLGFRLNVDRQPNGSHLAELASDSKFDLILMDYDLQKTDGKKINGDELIRQIRQEQNVYTEIVFYSNISVEQLRTAVFENGKSDGVYCFNRSDKDFPDNISKIINTTIKKVMDTNNMRGLAMASVADCDRHVIDAIATRWAQLKGDNKDAIRQKTLEKLESMQSSISDQVKEMQSEDDVRKILSSHGYPSQSRFNVLNSVTKPKKKCAEVGPPRERAQRYSEILAHRNRLGHARAIEKDGHVVFEGHEEIVYDDAKFGELRKEMIGCEGALKLLVELIAAGKLD